MQIVSLVLLAIGGITAFVGGIIFLIAAFRESVLWGLGCIFIPFVSLIFLVLHWAEAKKGFFIQIVGLALVVIAILIGGHGAIPTSH